METPPHTDKKSPSANRSYVCKTADEPDSATSAAISRDGSTSSPGTAVGLSHGVQAQQNGTRSGVTECKLGDSNVGTGGDPMKFENGQKKFSQGIFDRVGEIGHPDSSFRQDGAMFDDGEVFVNGGERGRPVLGKLSPVYKKGSSRTSGGGTRRRQSVQVKESDHCSDSETDEFLSRKNVVTSTPEYRGDILILQAEVSALQDRCRYELEQLPDNIRKPMVSDYDKEDERFLSMPVLTNERDRLQGTAKRYHKRIKKRNKESQTSICEYSSEAHGVQLNFTVLRRMK